MAAQARDLEAVLREVLGDGERAVVVVNSLGGGIILAHSAEFGDERVAGVVFAGSGGSGVTFWAPNPHEPVAHVRSELSGRQDWPRSSTASSVWRRPSSPVPSTPR